MPRNLIRDEDGQVLDLDEATGGIPIVDRFDYHLHQGNVYEASHTFNLTTLNTGIIHIKTNSIKDSHVIISGSFLGEGEIEIFEGPTLTGDGTVVPSYNINRQSTNTADVLIYHTPAITADGTSIFKSVIPGGRLAQATGHTGKSRERLFANNTSYLVKYTNTSGVTEDLTAIIEFYEETHNE